MANAKHLLVVDDQRDFTDFVVDVATRLGYTAQAANRVRQFQEMYVTQIPDVIILDIIMPECDGIELIKWLAEKECRAQIMIASGSGDTYTRSAKLLGEAQGSLRISVLHKPIKLDTLRTCLSEAATKDSLVTD